MRRKQPANYLFHSVKSCTSKSKAKCDTFDVKNNCLVESNAMIAILSTKLNSYFYSMLEMQAHSCLHSLMFCITVFYLIINEASDIN